MKIEVLNLDGDVVGDIDLSNNVFGLEMRSDVLHRVIEWQRAKKRRGTRGTKDRSGVSGTTKKPWKQKGTGRARLGSLRAAQCVGGGVVFGASNRDFEYKLTKKYKKLGLKVALSLKMREQKLKILDELGLPQISTSKVKDNLNRIGVENVLFVDSTIIDNNFKMSVNNLYKVDVIPSIGANVYDILNHEYLVLTKEAVKSLEERLI